MFRGETFEDTALRKVRDETGAGAAAAAASTKVISVWNTFFPDSSWDEGRKPEHIGTQTVNVTVFVRLKDVRDDLVNSEKAKQWAVESHKWVAVSDVLLHPRRFDKYVTLNVRKCRAKGFL